MIEREWKWAQSQGIRRWTQMGLSALSIQLPLAKCQTQWQAIRTDGNRTWRLPWGTHSLGVGKQMEEQISYDPAHQSYRIITQGMKEPTQNSLNPVNWGWEAGMQRSKHSQRGSVFVSLTLLNKVTLYAFTLQSTASISFLEWLWGRARPSSFNTVPSAQ